MPYYSIRLIGGSRTKHLDIKAQFNGRDADHTGVTSFFYVERSYDIEMMKRNAASLAGSKISVEVEEIGEDEFDWMKRRTRR
ncbi:MAG: hypothetical protein B7Y45_13480 [Sphingomonas sp. 28-66-16]|nr:MAG: hypothetical protein B7Y45_13480 [Sphingomonas sp. 28-66-16]